MSQKNSSDKAAPGRENNKPPADGNNQEYSETAAEPDQNDIVTLTGGL